MTPTIIGNFHHDQEIIDAVVFYSFVEEGSAGIAFRRGSSQEELSWMVSISKCVEIYGNKPALFPVIETIILHELTHWAGEEGSENHEKDRWNYVLYDVVRSSGFIPIPPGPLHK